jgi:hypothetical protein
VNPSFKFARVERTTRSVFSDPGNIVMLLRTVTLALLPVLLACGSERAPRSADSVALQSSDSDASKGAGKRKRAAAKQANTALSPEQVRKVRQSTDIKMASCYEVAPAKAALASGTVKVEFEVTTAGFVKNEAITENTLEDAILGNCVLDVVRRTTFPETTAPTGVSWALRFSADK